VRSRPANRHAITAEQQRSGGTTSIVRRRCAVPVVTRVVPIGYLPRPHALTAWRAVRVPAQMSAWSVGCDRRGLLQQAPTWTNRVHQRANRRGVAPRCCCCRPGMAIRTVLGGRTASDQGGPPPAIVSAEPAELHLCRRSRSRRLAHRSTQNLLPVAEITARHPDRCLLPATICRNSPVPPRQPEYIM
jgi:hypothetical protein